MGRHRYERRTGLFMATGSVLVAGIAAAVAVPAIAGTDPETPEAAQTEQSAQPTEPAQSAQTGSPGTNADVVAALQRDLGLTGDQARDRLSAEASARDTLRTLRGTLGTSYAGAWFDAAASTLVVGVTDPARMPEVRAAGAQARVQEDSMAELTGAKARLDGMGTAVPDSVTRWYVEPSSNSVVVEVNSGERDAAADRLVRTVEATGANVRVESTTQSPRPFADLIGGDPYTFQAQGGEGRCSIGFSATGADGSEHFLTAGHCTEGGGTALDADGAEIGPSSESTFGAEGDFGLVDVTGEDSQPTALVNRYDGTAIEITGSEEAPVGASICRSGSTTGFFCGEVAALDQTVNYGNGDIVNGLTGTTVCAEPGDSGGSFLSGTEAQGLTSGGSGDCTSGGETFFQPVNEALDAFGLTLVTGSTG